MVASLLLRAAFVEAQDDSVFYHTVERGQTVYSIARMYDVKPEDVFRLNIGSDEGIKIGYKLRIPQKSTTVSATASDGVAAYIYHTIQARETLYGVSKTYDVRPISVMEANPGLTHETFSTGKIIRIPVNSKRPPVNEVVETPLGAKEVYYTVPARETMYNICKRFKTTENELLKLNPELSGGLRNGMVLRIPLRIDEKDIPPVEEPAPQEVNAMLDVKTPAKPVKAAKIALLLPYDADSPNSSAAGLRVIEYYEGMLLAADSLRKLGYSLELFVFDIGEKQNKLDTLLKYQSDVLASANLLIGGVSNEQIKTIADFARANKIKYVIPFTSKNEEVLNNAYIFQVNSPQQYLCDNAAFAAAKMYDKYNIIFIETKDKEEQTDFIKTFKQQLKDRNIEYKDIKYREAGFEADLLGALTKDKPNVALPTSASLDALDKIKTVLRSVAHTRTDFSISLFGFPKWQTYYKDCLDDFHDLNACIYSLFYADNMTPAVQNFYDKYKRWYSKSPMSSFPKYAMLGFDTGMFFFSAVQKYGANFETSLAKLKYPSIQTGFNFERVNNWGGFINTNIYLVHYNRDFSISREDYK
jgi:LysM repeat protein/ABC-type branched-subunit amino acid transport system substrate-binding protein